jgi:hypothetical protein
VFREIIDHLDHQYVTRVVIDFEPGVWQAVRQVFPQVTIQGCVFHYSQALWRKATFLGLTDAYKELGPVYEFIKRMMALPFLPREHIRASWVELRALAVRTVQPVLVTFSDYIEKYWLDSTVWSLETWSCFMTPVRTNNDTEGWHRRLKVRADRKKLQVYALAPLLHQEALLVTAQMRAVSHGTLTRHQRLQVRDMQGRIFALWDDLVAGRKTPSEVLRGASYQIGPSDV